MMVHLSCQPVEHLAIEMCLNCHPSFWLICASASTTVTVEKLSLSDNSCKVWECGCSHRWFSRVPTIHIDRKRVFASLNLMVIGWSYCNTKSFEWDQLISVHLLLELKGLPVDYISAWFQFLVLVVWLNRKIDQCKYAVSDTVLQ